MRFTITIKIINIVLLLTYSSYVFRVIAPLADYVVNYNYIISELCIEKDKTENNCLGKCHLTKEIEKQTKQSSERAPTVKIDLLKIHHIIKLSDDLNLVKEYKKLNSFNLFQKEIRLSIKPNLPPPKI